jgi:hypothetical protein
VTSGLPLSAEFNYLSVENAQSLLNWGAERYRRRFTADR